MPVLVNLFGTVERVAWGMDREPSGLREIGETLAFLQAAGAARRLARGVGDAAAAQDRDGDAAAHRRRARPARRSCCAAAKSTLRALPVQTCWPGEPAPLITWPLVVTKGPGERREDDFNLGIYRMQVTGRDTTFMRWLKHRGGAQHHARWKRRAARAAAGRGGDRRRSGHDPRRRDAGARHAVGIPVRRAAARRARSSWSTARPCR